MSVLTPIKLKEANKDLIKRILKRSSLNMEEIEDKVREIIHDVFVRGDDAIIEFYKKFFGTDALTQEKLVITEEEMEEALETIPTDLLEALEVMAKNIKRFHQKQLPRELWIFELEPGIYVGQFWKPVDSVGVYVPGGRAAYPSTALMTIIPAKVVGVPKVVACTPPRPDASVDPVTLAALRIAGVDEAYRVGGAHAVAAMAFGTETVPKVEKVVGPGNVWVATAKKLLYGTIDVDFIAGPSEILIIADGEQDPHLVAVDLISQAEHDPMAAAVLVTTSEELARKVAEEFDRIAEESPRAEIVFESLKRNGAIFVVDSIDEAFEFANEYAPEHLEVLVRDMSLPEVVSRVRSAGSVFVGINTPVPLGDYAIGTNHVLPTDQAAKRRGGLSVFDYIKIIDVQLATEDGLKRLGPYAARVARAEGLVEHARSVEERLKRMS